MRRHLGSWRRQVQGFRRRYRGVVRKIRDIRMGRDGGHAKWECERLIDI